MFSFLHIASPSKKNDLPAAVCDFGFGWEPGNLILELYVTPNRKVSRHHYLEKYHSTGYSRRWRTLARPPLRPQFDLWARRARMKGFCNGQSQLLADFELAMSLL
jgi:hypothetical protein